MSANERNEYKAALDRFDQSELLNAIGVLGSNKRQAASNKSEEENRNFLLSHVYDSNTLAKPIRMRIIDLVLHR